MASDVMQAVNRDMQIREQAPSSGGQCRSPTAGCRGFPGLNPCKPRLARGGIVTRSQPAPTDLSQKFGQHLLRRFWSSTHRSAFDRDVQHQPRGAWPRRIGHKGRRSIQHRAKAARLHPIRRATHVQVDLVIPRLAPPIRAASASFVRNRTAKLPKATGCSDTFMISKMHSTAAHKAGESHFSIKATVSCENTGACSGQLTVGPVHHGCNG